MESEADIEKRETRLVLRVMWTGLFLLTFVEIALALMLSKTDGSVATGTGARAAVFLAMAAGLLGLVFFIYHKKIGGGQIATALLCWMLSKGVSMLGVAAAFLSDPPALSFGLIGIFFVDLFILRPSLFEVPAVKPRVEAPEPKPEPQHA